MHSCFFKLSNQNFMYTSNQPSAKYADTYQQVTNYVIEALEKGDIIWRKPWGNMTSFPKNLITQKAYKGWNHFYLTWIAASVGFDSPYFLTFKHVQFLDAK